MLPQARWAGLLGILAASAHAQPPCDLPSRFEADRVYVTPTTQDGQVLRLFTDSGGGLFLRQAAATRLGLEAVAPDDAKKETNDAAQAQPSTVRLPAFADGKGIPPPMSGDGRVPVMPPRIQAPLPGLSADDGMLGQAWFSGRIWTWDYPGRKLRIEGAHWRASKDMRRVPLGFKTSASGTRELDFPRIEVTIDGHALPLLLDTGATTVLTPDALAALDDGLPAERATSMIANSVFQAWHKAHPDWRIIEDAQAGTGSAMIEVPDVEIAGWRVGPVWFTHRANRNFHEFMSSFSDQRVEGAIGGNALEHFVMTVDYPGAAAYFRCAKDCGNPR